MSSNSPLTRTLRRLLFGMAALSLGLVSPAFAQDKPLPPGMFSVAPGAGGPARPLTTNMVLTLDDAINQALQRQPTIQAAQASLQSALAAQAVANSHMAGLSPAAAVRRQQAALGVGAAEANVRQVEMETKNAVNRTYLGVIYAREQLKLADDAVQTLRATFDVAKRLLESGSKNITKDDLDKLDIYVNLAESRKGEALVGKARALAALREAIGLPHDAIFDVDQGKLSRFYEIAQEYTKSNNVRLNCNCATDMAVRYRPELTQASIFAEVACLEVQAQSRDLFHPYSKTFAATSDIHAKVLPGSIINGEYRPGPVGPEFPTFLAGSAAQRSERASILHGRALSVVDKARGLVALEAEEGCARLNRASEQIELLRKASGKSTELYKKAEEFFRQDQYKTTDLLTAYGLDVQNRSQLNEAYYQFGMTLAFLQRATAGRLWECFEVNK
jgi:outer membrane protein TolC